MRETGRAMAETIQRIEKEDGKPYRILLAEDKEVAQLLGINVLEQLGCEVDVVKNGQEALLKIKELDYDVVFMDCNMPIMDGYRATKAIRDYEASTGEYKHVSVIALTAKVMLGDKEKCLAAGMDDYTTKPLRVDSAGVLIQRWCREAVRFKEEW